MADTKETNSTSKERSEQLDFKFCCGDSEAMSRMMPKFCCGEVGTFDCGEMMQMMQKMCCTRSGESG
jgi:hypothetical protein